MFEAVQGRHHRVEVSDLDALPGDLRVGLARSLPTFQLGETGEGRHLRAKATMRGDENYLRAIELFVQEEQEHARLLALVLGELNIPLATKHWTDNVFVVVRQLAGLRVELLTLMVAELISLRFYQALRDGTTNPELRDLFGRIHQDELRHLDFHYSTLPQQLNQWPRPTRWFAKWCWRALVAGASVVVAMDHQVVLRACDVSTWEFLRDCRRNRHDACHQLFGIVEK